MPSDGRHGRCFRAVTGAGGFETRPYGCYGRTDAWHEIMVNEHHAAHGRRGSGGYLLDFDAGLAGNGR